jgi:hypothetical protein
MTKALVLHTCHDIEIGVTGGGKRSVTQGKVLQTDRERFTMTKGLVLHADR